ncbi:hypothetical protein PLICRDRAFT_36057 [Plicaturopsis crispa FD-325 SS-3]|nr:hypothetical protein PLICRDRAFT_36057 [Plicaturopsis crispa FD-325 SS-3]
MSFRYCCFMASTPTAAHSRLTPGNERLRGIAQLVKSQCRARDPPSDLPLQYDCANAVSPQGACGLGLGGALDHGVLLRMG